jgi:hypothetical protein
MRIITHNQPNVNNIIHQTQENLVEAIGQFTVPCPICGEDYHRVGQHAQAKHGIIIADFKDTYHYTTATGAAAYKLLRLYGGRTDRYIEQTISHKTGKPIYVTYDATTQLHLHPWDRFLGLRKVISHLRGTRTYGVTFHDYRAKFFGFDIDFYFTSPGNQQIILLMLIGTLKSLNIPRDCIHLLGSGMKGFHIDLYFDDWIPIQHLLELGKRVLELTELANTPPYVTVEFRPEAISGGRGIRLPLGIHQATGAVMQYLNDPVYLKPYPNQYEYLLYSTNTILRQDFYKYIYPNVQHPIRYQTKGISWAKNNVVPIKKPIVRRHYTRSELEGFLVTGLKHHGTRHNVTLGLAILLKERGHSPPQVISELTDWSKHKRNGCSKSTRDEIVDDIQLITDYTFTRDYHLEEPETKWLLTDTDVKKILENIYLSLAEHKTLAAYFMIRRRYGKDAYYPQEIIAAMAGITSRTVRKHTTNFINLGILKLTYRGNSFRMHSNKYEILDYQDFYVNALAFEKEDINSETFIKALKHFLPIDFIKARYSHYLVNVRINPVSLTGYTRKLHPAIPSKTQPIPTIKLTPPQKQIVARKIFEQKFIEGIISLFLWVRSQKRKYGAVFAKLFVSKGAYYLRC